MAAALLYGCHKAPIESGVSRELAQERATHISNVRYELSFHLPEDKEAMLELIRKRRDQLAGRLDERPVRYGEGAVL